MPLGTQLYDRDSMLDNSVSNVCKVAKIRTLENSSFNQKQEMLLLPLLTMATDKEGVYVRLLMNKGNVNGNM